MVAAVGTFDGVHLGHRALIGQVLAEAKARGQECAIFTFAGHPLDVVAPERVPRLITPIEEKMRLLRQAGIDRVISLGFDQRMRSLTARQFMEMLRDEHEVQALVVGFNNHFGRDREGNFSTYQAIGQEIGIDVIRGKEQALEVERGQIVPVSSSSIRVALSRNQIERANLMLGRPYRLCGTVAQGQGIGRTIGWPTANVQPSEPRQLIPARGVYAADAYTADGQRWPAMVNIGKRPTIADNLEPTIEAHLIGYEGDLYGQPITLDFKRFIRPEQRFPSLAALQSQLALDLKNVST